MKIIRAYYIRLDSLEKQSFHSAKFWILPAVSVFVGHSGQGFLMLHTTMWECYGNISVGGNSKHKKPGLSHQTLIDIYANKCSLELKGTCLPLSNLECVAQLTLYVPLRPCICGGREGSADAASHRWPRGQAAKGRAARFFPIIRAKY